MAAPDSKVTPNEFFQDIGQQVDNSSEEEHKLVEEIESLCMNCHENGVTRMLLTSIPYFREVIIMSFACEHCGLQNNEVQPAGTVQPKGTYYELRLTDMADFARQVVKSDTATVKFTELDLEVPSGKGQLTNVEGLLSTVIEDLEFGQEARKQQAPDVAEKVGEVIAKGRAMLAGSAFPFRVTVDDPAGNSFITPDLKDGVGKWEKHEFLRTAEQNEALGLSGESTNNANADATMLDPNPSLDADGNIIPNEVYSFPASCPGCMQPCTTHMKMVDIPHFKQVVLMSTVCDACGYRSNDVKTGGEIPELGEKITIAVRDTTDLARDILKSESCALECPELGLSVNPGTLGGRQSPRPRARRASWRRVALGEDLGRVRDAGLVDDGGERGRDDDALDAGGRAVEGLEDGGCADDGGVDEVLLRHSLEPRRLDDLVKRILAGNVRHNGDRQASRGQVLVVVADLLRLVLGTHRHDSIMTLLDELLEDVAADEAGAA
ncbi:hypothetical protein BN1708_001476 [Verticillium longisporum]|uniref:Zinc finger ZPR1-type domain-containing protein n=1 Tax=Verticillium longisporum TaxID=100787 RepID=A0A0G4MTE0_VERLO|nr:hypothetical protein BN1708_001476 [Verticillium longisporum]